MDDRYIDRQMVYGWWGGCMDGLVWRMEDEWLDGLGGWMID